MAHEGAQGVVAAGELRCLEGFEFGELALAGGVTRPGAEARLLARPDFDGTQQGGESRMAHLAGPVAQVVCVRLAETEGEFDIVDPRRAELGLSFGVGRLVHHEFAVDRLHRPEDDGGLALVDHLADDLAVLVAREQGEIPPHVEAELFERAGQLLGDGAVLAFV